MTTSTSRLSDAEGSCPAEDSAAAFALCGFLTPMLNSCCCCGSARSMRSRCFGVGCRSCRPFSRALSLAGSPGGAGASSGDVGDGGGCFDLLKCRWDF